MNGSALQQLRKSTKRSVMLHNTSMQTLVVKLKTSDNRLLYVEPKTAVLGPLASMPATIVLDASLAPSVPLRGHHLSVYCTPLSTPSSVNSARRFWSINGPVSVSQLAACLRVLFNQKGPTREMVVNLPGTASLVVDEQTQLDSDVTQLTVSPATLCSTFWDYFYTVFPPAEQSTDSDTDIVFPCGSA